MYLIKPFYKYFFLLHILLYFTPQLGSNRINFSINIVIMQDNERKFSEIIGRVIKNLRQNNPKKYVIFCDENCIADSTLNNIESGSRSPKLYTIARIIKALGLSFKEFGEILDKELTDEIFKASD